MVKVPAHIFRAQLGSIFEQAVKNRERFVVLKKGKPQLVCMSIEDFVASTDEFEDVEDFLDTLAEETDLEFQRSLKASYWAIQRGEFITEEEMFRDLDEGADG